MGGEARKAAEREAALAKMSVNRQEVEALKVHLQTQIEKMVKGRKEPLNGNSHSKANQLPKKANESPDWNAEEKLALGEIIRDLLPQAVEKIDKDQLKKLKVNALLGKT